MFRKAWLTAALVFVVGCSRYTGVDASAPDASVKGLAAVDSGPTAPRATSLFGDGGIRHVGAAFGAVGGDLAGYMPEPTIAKIDGINLPAPSGTSTVLTYGGGALSWSLPPAAGDGGAGVVWANDLVGSTNSAQYVAAISGQGGSTPNVPVSATSFTWGTSGTFIGNTTVKGVLTESDSSANKLWQLTEVPSSTTPAIYAGSVTPGSANYCVKATSTQTFINASNVVGLSVANSPMLSVSAVSALQTYDSSGNPLWQATELPTTTDPALYSSGVTPSASNFIVSTHTSSGQVSTTVNGPGSGQVNLAISGNPLFEVFASATTTLDPSGHVLLQFTEVPSTTSGAIYSGAVTVGTGNYALAATSLETYLNSPSGGKTVMASNGVPILAVGPTGGNTAGLAPSQNFVSVTGSGYNLTATESLLPYIILSTPGGGNMTTNFQLGFPNVNGLWFVDISGINATQIGSYAITFVNQGGGANACGNYTSADVTATKTLITVGTTSATTIACGGL